MIHFFPQLPHKTNLPIVIFPASITFKTLFIVVLQILTGIFCDPKKLPLETLRGEVTVLFFFSKKYVIVLIRHSPTRSGLINVKAHEIRNLSTRLPIIHDSQDARGASTILTMRVAMKTWAGFEVTQAVRTCHGEIRVFSSPV